MLPATVASSEIANVPFTTNIASSVPDEYAGLTFESTAANVS